MERRPLINAELIYRLVAETVQAPDWRSGYARLGHLPLFSNMGLVILLTSAGEVVMNDEEDGPLRPAGPTDRDFALARAAELYPELAHLRPPRPSAAGTCNICRGLGRLTVTQGRVSPWQDQADNRSFVYCPDCNSLGWTVAG